MFRITKSCPTGRNVFIMSLTTISIAREWNTLLLIVNNNTINGNSDRIALAATLKAYVWTSVRIMYRASAAI